MWIVSFILFVQLENLLEPIFLNISSITPYFGPWVRTYTKVTYCRYIFEHWNTTEFQLNFLSSAKRPNHQQFCSDISDVLLKLTGWYQKLHHHELANGWLLEWYWISNYPTRYQVNSLALQGHNTIIDIDTIDTERRREASRKVRDW